jgi:hypothetical protein
VIAHGTVWSFSPENEQHGFAIRISGVDLRLSPRVEVRRCSLEQRLSGGGHGEGFVQILGLLLGYCVGECVTELLLRQRDRAVPVGGVAECC